MTATTITVQAGATVNIFQTGSTVNQVSGLTKGYLDAAVTSALAPILQGITTMSTALDALKANVAQLKTVDESAIALLQGLKTRLDEAVASGDMAQVQALSDEIGADNAALAKAVTDNTPTA